MKRLRPRAGKRLNTSNYIKVDDDSIVAVDYLPSKEILEVKYQPNTIYQFIDVPQSYWTRISQMVTREPAKLSSFIKEMEVKFYYYMLQEQGLITSNGKANQD